jgi:hypothetical protein
MMNQNPPLDRAKQVLSHVAPIRRTYKIYGAFVTILNLGLVGWLRHQDPDLPMRSLMQSVVVMTPLTMGVLLLARAYFLNRRVSLTYIAMCTLGTLAFSWLFGIASGGAVAQAFLHPTTCFSITGVAGAVFSSCTEDESSGPLWFVFGWPSRLMRAYSAVYGDVGFLTAVASGIFLGLVWVNLTQRSQ